MALHLSFEQKDGAAAISAEVSTTVDMIRKGSAKPGHSEAP